jgi:hypothetical protein
VIRFNRDTRSLEGPRSPIGLACAIGLPVLRDISMSNANHGDWDLDNQDMLVLKTAGTSREPLVWTSKIYWPPAMSNIKSLEFKEFYLEPEFLLNVLKTCRSLRHLIFRKCCTCTAGSSVDIELAALVGSLNMHRHSLETPILDCDYGKWLVYSPSLHYPIHLSLIYILNMPFEDREGQCVALPRKIENSAAKSSNNLQTIRRYLCDK